MNFPMTQGPDWAMALAAVLFLVTAVIHLTFAFGVYASAAQRFENQGVHFAPPVIWSLATLLGGVFVATAYWLIHLSTLSPRHFSIEPSG